MAVWHGLAPQVVIAGTPGARPTCALERVVAAHVTGRIRRCRCRRTVRTRRFARACRGWRRWGLRDGRATAYVCRDFTCREPVTDPEALGRELQGRGG